jgi:radical SAM superfamily enzyme YgiQ (UPF0313 family)
MTTVQLIRPPLDPWYKEKRLESMTTVPANLCLLANCVEFPDRVIVSDYLDNLEGKPDKDAQLVGATDLYASHLSALKLMKQAKRNGSETVLGGFNVDFLAERILRNHHYVDYVVVGDGEEALAALVWGENPELISNLVYRDGDQIIRNEREFVPINRLFSLRHLDDLEYDIAKPVPLSGVRGCIKAESEGRCSFCSIDRRLKVASPEIYWHQIRLLYEEYGFSYFWESGDSFLVGNFPRRVLEARPSDLDHIQFKAFTSPTGHTPEMTRTLIELGMKELFIGVESANDNILRRANKSYTVRDIVDALELFRGSRVDLHLPFMYGLEGETRDTAKANFEFAKWATGEFDVSIVISSLPVILPGTELFENIRRDERISAEYEGDLDRDDFFDYNALTRLHLEHFTDVDFEEMEELVRKTRALGSREGTSFMLNSQK